MDVAALKTEIKAWERSFKASNGRDPSVQDIKNQPGLAEKYKLYKKLSKAADPPPHTKRSTPPSTPPRSQTRDSTHQSLLLSKPRAIAATQPLAGYNPFSPQKNKGKQKDQSQPFPIARNLPPASTASTSKDPFAPTPNNAVSRARKRLRGEPVSPSPNKEKRRRLADDSDDEDEDGGAADTSFVDDSPVKPPTGVRSFKLLFDEAAEKPKFPLSRSKTLRTSPFRAKPTTLDDDDGMEIDEPSKPLVVDSQDNPFLDLGDVGPPSSNGETRPTSEEEMVEDPAATTQAISSRALLAPSPPPAPRNPSSQTANTGKGRAKANGGKKARVATSTSDDEDESDAENHSRQTVKIFSRTAFRGRVKEDDDDDETYRIKPRRTEEDIDPIETASEIISVPDTLLNVLSLAPRTSHEREEKHVVQRLLYGASKGNYDPTKGGEIWGVGEFEEEERDEFASRHAVARDDGDEDDWEGEGVPWEVAEL